MFRHQVKLQLKADSFAVLSQKVQNTMISMLYHGPISVIEEILDGSEKYYSKG